MKTYLAEILVLLATPALFVAAMALGIVGIGGQQMLATAFTSILPASLCCLAMSYRLSRQPGNSDSDAKEFVEFLLGTMGMIYFVFGLIFSLLLIMWMV